MEYERHMRPLRERLLQDPGPLTATRLVSLLEEADGTAGVAWVYLMQETPQVADILAASLREDFEPPEVMSRVHRQAVAEAHVRGNGQVNGMHYVIAYLDLGESPGVRRLVDAGMCVPFVLFHMRAYTGRGLRRGELLHEPKIPLLRLADFPEELRDNEWIRDFLQGEVVKDERTREADPFIQIARAAHKFKGLDARQALIDDVIRLVDDHDDDESEVT